MNKIIFKGMNKFVLLLIRVTYIDGVADPASDLLLLFLA